MHAFLKEGLGGGGGTLLVIYSTCVNKYYWFYIVSVTCKDAGLRGEAGDAKLW